MSERHLSLFSKRKIVQKSSFRRVKAGLGAFEHERILFPIGRISYSSFSEHPPTVSGKVQVTFFVRDETFSVTDDAHSLKGETTIIF